MKDFIIALVCLAAFCGFVTLVMVYIKEVDLIIICVAVMLCAAYDFWRTLTARKADEKDGA